MRLKTSLPSEWDRQAESWDEGIHSPEWPHYHYYKTFDIHLAGLLKGCKRVLELGCGTGDCTVNYVSHTEEIVASDFSKRMVVTANEKMASRSIRNVHLAIFDAQHIPSRDRAFDGLFSRGALINYVHQPEELLAEIYRVVLPGSIVVLDMISGRPGGEAKLYSTAEVNSLLESTGFREIGFRPMGMFLRCRSNPSLIEFVNSHRDIFCLIESEMHEAFKLDHSVMTLIAARRRGRSSNQAS